MSNSSSRKEKESFGEHPKGYHPIALQKAYAKYHEIKAESHGTDYGTFAESIPRKFLFHWNMNPIWQRRNEETWRNFIKSLFRATYLTLREKIVSLWRRQVNNLRWKIGTQNIATKMAYFILATTLLDKVSIILVGHKSQLKSILKFEKPGNCSTYNIAIANKILTRRNR